MILIGVDIDRLSCWLQLLVDQFTILETMTPLDFLHFRYLTRSCLLLLCLVHKRGQK